MNTNHILCLIIILLVIVIYYYKNNNKVKDNNNNKVKDNNNNKVKDNNKNDDYKYKLKYLLTNELTHMCNKVKDNNNNIMVMMFTKGHIEEAKNCIYSYKKSTNKNNILVFALDNETKIAMDNYNIPCYYHSLFYDEAVKDTDYMTKQFIHITLLKILVVFSVLSNGINVLWTDTDIVYFKNPYNKFKKINKSIIIQNNSNNNNNIDNLCSGFMYYKYDIISKDFLTKCIDFTNNNYNDIPGDGADQGVINYNINKEDVYVLPVEEFPNGLAWWGKGTRKPLDFDRRNSYIVHNNWIVGLDNKVKRFKESGLWFL